ncbi:sigma-70 family RNA polymerase sigma factor [bacterium]|nr:sigma-70 family RNA polymerase sigma factor [bacterium]
MDAPERLCDSDELVAMLRAGDPQILDRVTRCYGDQLLAAARRTCSSEEDARDALQDATLGAWRYGPGFRGEGRVDRWLVRLVATACNRLRRGLKNTRHLHHHDIELTSDDADPELLAARAELAETLGELLLQLPPTDRGILILADAQGWTGPEIAEALGMTPGAVRTRLSRTHARLRERLDPPRG